MIRFVVAIIAGLLLTTLQGCVTKQSLPELPSTLGDNGLLVARLYVLGMRGMEDASINIDGKLMPSSLRDGYIAVSLAPGEHKLSQIQAAGQLLSANIVEDNPPIRRVRGGGGPAFIYIPGGSYTVHYTTLSIDRSFHIEPGKVTNLGLIVYLPVMEDPDRKRATVNNSREFRVVALDNSAEINTFLETNYPELVGSLKTRDIILAPGRYLEAKHLPDLRRAIAFHESRGTQVLSSPTKNIVYGRAGTIVAIDKQPGADSRKLEILDTGTLADIVGAAWNGTQFIFMTSDAKLLSWDGQTISQTTLPYRVHPVHMRSLGEVGLVAVDNHLRILSARQYGNQWVNYEGAMIKNARSDVTIASDGAGVYISLGNRGFPEALYYLKAGESLPKAITGPEPRPAISSADYHVVVAREAGLFVVFNRPDYYFWSKAKQRWDAYSRPAGNCKPMKIDDQGLNVVVECDGVEYRSSNSGGTWTKPEV